MSTTTSTSTSSPDTHDQYRFRIGAADGTSIRAFIKSNAVILSLGGTLLVAAIGATWLVTNVIHDGDLEVRRTIRQSEQRLRDEMGVLREDFHQAINELRSTDEANYRDLRDLIEGDK